LKYGFSLLSFYLNHDKALSNYNVDKIINFRDKDNLVETWKDVNLEDIIDTLGNFVVLDIPKKNISFSKKNAYYNKSGLSEVRQIITPDFTKNDLWKRDKELKQRLVKFFNGK